MTQLKHIALVTTGGTIAGRSPDPAVTADYQIDSDGERLLQSVPGLDEHARLETHHLFQIDSSAIDTQQQLQIVQYVTRLLGRADVDGVVITHGTDSLVETALLLQLCLKSSKPVVLTGAMRPASALSADGPLNLHQAVRVAAHTDAHNLGVLVVMNDQIHSARFIRKTHSSQPDAFASPDTGPLGIICNQVIYIGATPRRPHTTRSPFQLSEGDTLPAVDIIYDHPGANLALYEAALGSQRAGIVIAGMGNGSLSPTAQQGALMLGQAGVPVIRATQQPGGPVVPTALDEQLGTFAAHWWSPNGARILLSLCLKEQYRAEQIRHALQHY